MLQMKQYFLKNGVQVLLRSGLLILFLVLISATAQAEHRLACTFDRAVGFKVLQGKVEATRSSSIVSLTIIDEDLADGTASLSSNGTLKELSSLDTPVTINYTEPSPTGGLTIVTVHKSVLRSPGRYLATLMNTAPLAAAGATPTLSVGTCSVKPAF